MGGAPAPPPLPRERTHQQHAATAVRGGARTTSSSESSRRRTSSRRSRCSPCASAGGGRDDVAGAHAAPPASKFVAPMSDLLWSRSAVLARRAGGRRSLSLPAGEHELPSAELRRQTPPPPTRRARVASSFVLRTTAAHAHGLSSRSRAARRWSRSASRWQAGLGGRRRAGKGGRAGSGGGGLDAAPVDGVASERRGRSSRSARRHRRRRRPRRTRRRLRRSAVWQRRRTWSSTILAARTFATSSGDRAEFSVDFYLAGGAPASGASATSAGEVGERVAGGGRDGVDRGEDRVRKRRRRRDRGASFRRARSAPDRVVHARAPCRSSAGCGTCERAAVKHTRAARSLLHDTTRSAGSARQPQRARQEGGLQPSGVSASCRS